MMNKENFKELIRYGINGVLTTAVNYVVYFLLLQCHVNYLVANTIAWVAAVLFAYYTNRKMVFHSDQDVKKEFLSFVGLRFITLLAENMLLFSFINLLSFSPMWSKLFVSVITVLANYIICKSKIFIKGENQHG